jgi:hypothetical protein
MKITVIGASAAVAAMLAFPGVALADGIDDTQSCFGEAPTILATPGEVTFRDRRPRRDPRHRRRRRHPRRCR